MTQEELLYPSGYPDDDYDLVDPQPYVRPREWIDDFYDHPTSKPKK